ncbi:MAG: AGE family epimerase/isomerase [bacterium]|nr:AGE family epimerase/isomerase [bacterium]
MDATRINELAVLYRDILLGDVIPFWTRHAVDREQGGYFTFLDRDGAIFSTDKPVWLQGRTVWVFSRLYNEVERRPEWLELARHGMRFLMDHCFDRDGRMFFMVDRDGRALRKRRYLFSETFAIMALAEFARATGEDWARQRAADLFDLVLRYHTTPGLLEPKDIPGARPAKAHAMPMILLATVQALERADDRPLYREVADRSLAEIFDHHCKPELRALLETVGPNGELIDTPEGRCINPGHAIESAWFVMEEGRRRDDADLARQALPILEWSLERGWDPEHGGLFYFTDLKGLPCVQYEWDMKLWWPHTEALYATLLAHRLTGEARWAEWHERLREWTWAHFPDPQYGEWFGYLHRDGSVSTRLKGNGWKGPFHLSRMLLYCWKLLGDWPTQSDESSS